MQKNVDEMLQLTAVIAEELLLLKDNGGYVTGGLAEKTVRLAELATQALGETETECEIAEAAKADEVEVSDLVIAEKCKQSEQVDVEVPEEEPEIQPMDVVEMEEPVAQVAAEEHRVEASTLRKAFSLNDLFYYRRTLFENSQQRFNEALEALGNAKSGAEAAAILGGIFGVDAESDDAVAFIDLIIPFLS